MRILSVASDAYAALAVGARTVLNVPEPAPVPFIPGDRLRIRSAAQPDLVVRITDVALAVNDQTLLSVRRLEDLPKVWTPGGTIRAVADPDGDSPGIALTIDGTVAAVVEWHPEQQSIVLRTYNPHEDTPQHSYRWDDTALDP